MELEQRVELLAGRQPQAVSLVSQLAKTQPRLAAELGLVLLMLDALPVLDEPDVVFNPYVVATPENTAEREGLGIVFRDNFARVVRKLFSTHKVVQQVGTGLPILLALPAITAVTGGSMYGLGAWTDWGFAKGFKQIIDSTAAGIRDATVGSANLAHMLATVTEYSGAAFLETTTNLQSEAVYFVEWARTSGVAMDRIVDFAKACAANAFRRLPYAPTRDLTEREENLVLTLGAGIALTSLLLVSQTRSGQRILGYSKRGLNAVFRGISCALSGPVEFVGSRNAIAAALWVSQYPFMTRKRQMAVLLVPAYFLRRALTPSAEEAAIQTSKTVQRIASGLQTQAEATVAIADKTSSAMTKVSEQALEQTRAQSDALKAISDHATNTMGAVTQAMFQQNRLMHGMMYQMHQERALLVGFMGSVMGGPMALPMGRAFAALEDGNTGSLRPPVDSQLPFQTYSTQGGPSITEIESIIPSMAPASDEKVSCVLVYEFIPLIQCIRFSPSQTMASQSLRRSDRNKNAADNTVQLTDTMEATRKPVAFSELNLLPERTRASPSKKPAPAGSPVLIPVKAGWDKSVLTWNKFQSTLKGTSKEFKSKAYQQFTTDGMIDEEVYDYLIEDAAFAPYLPAPEEEEEEADAEEEEEVEATDSRPVEADITTTPIETLATGDDTDTDSVHTAEDNHSVADEPVAKNDISSMQLTTIQAPPPVQKAWLPVRAAKAFVDLVTGGSKPKQIEAAPSQPSSVQLPATDLVEYDDGAIAVFTADTDLLPEQPLPTKEQLKQIKAADPKPATTGDWKAVPAEFITTHDVQGILIPAIQTAAFALAGVYDETKLTLATSEDMKQACYDAVNDDPLHPYKDVTKRLLARHFELIEPLHSATDYETQEKKADLKSVLEQWRRLVKDTAKWNAVMLDLKRGRAQRVSNALANLWNELKLVVTWTDLKHSVEHLPDLVHLKKLATAAEDDVTPNLFDAVVLPGADDVLNPASLNLEQVCTAVRGMEAKRQSDDKPLALLADFWATKTSSTIASDLKPPKQPQLAVPFELNAYNADPRFEDASGLYDALNRLFDADSLLVFKFLPWEAIHWLSVYNYTKSRKWLDQCAIPVKIIGVAPPGSGLIPEGVAVAAAYAKNLSKDPKTAAVQWNQVQPPVFSILPCTPRDYVVVRADVPVDYESFFKEVKARKEKRRWRCNVFWCTAKQSTLKEDVDKAKKAFRELGNETDFTDTDISWALDNASSLNELLATALAFQIAHAMPSHFDKVDLLKDGVGKLKERHTQAVRWVMEFLNDHPGAPWQRNSAALPVFSKKEAPVLTEARKKFAARWSTNSRVKRSSAI